MGDFYPVIDFTCIWQCVFSSHRKGRREQQLLQMNHSRTKPGTFSHMMPHTALGHSNTSTPKYPTEPRDARVYKYRVVFILPQCDPMVFSRATPALNPIAGR